MTTSDKIAFVSLIVSGLSFLAAIIALVQSHRSGKRADASLELEIRNAIQNARARVEDLAAAHMDLLAKGKPTAEEKRKLDAVKGLFASANEAVLNAYETACAKYFDNKVDVVRFEKDYGREIRQLVEDANFKDKFVGPTSPYPAVRQFYEKHSASKV